MISMIKMRIEEEGNEEEKGVEKLSYLRRRRGVEKKVVLENKDK